MNAPVLFRLAASAVPEKRATKPVPDHAKRGCAGFVTSTRPNQRTPAASRPVAGAPPPVPPGPAPADPPAPPLAPPVAPPRPPAPAPAPPVVPPRPPGPAPPVPAVPAV